MDFVKREHVYDEETYKAYMESIQKQHQAASSSLTLQHAVHSSIISSGQRAPLHRPDMITERDLPFSDLELQALTHQGLIQTIPEHDLSRLAADISQRLRSAAEPMGQDMGRVLPGQSGDKIPYIKLEQNDEYFYVAPQDNFGGNGVAGLLPPDSRECQLFPSYAAPGAALAASYRAAYPPDYVQSDPQNLVLPKYDQYAQNGGQQDGAQQNGAQQNGGAEVKIEQPKENMKPTENRYYDYSASAPEPKDKHDIEPSDPVVKGQYGCYKCTLVFSTKRGLKQHSKVCLDQEKQTGKVLCPQCPYTCQSSAILKIHERTHTGEKPFSCTFCDYKSGQKNNVAKHMMLHMHEKPFRCQYCDYRCAQKNNLVVHERTHTGYKPFGCSYCEYRTVQKANLVKHMYLHTDQKPYGCDLCSYKCVQKTNLTKHKLRHARDIASDSAVKCQKTLKCQQCDYSCVQKSSLVRHVSAKHAADKAGEKDFEFADAMLNTES